MYDMKTRTISIRLDDQTYSHLVALARYEGRNVSDFVRESVRRRLNIIRFKQLRKEVMPYAEQSGFLLDEDVFEATS